jgi:hypothetical protein
MSTSAISSTSTQPYSSTSGNGTNFRQDMKSLENSLLNGDLSGAQSAFAALQQLVTSAQSTASTTTSTASTSTTPTSVVSQLGQSSSTLGQDMQALSSALSSGNVSSAQSAFAKLQQDMHAAFQANAGQHAHGHGGGHHHHAPPADSDSQDSTSPLDLLLQSASSTQSTGSTSSDLLKALQTISTSNPKVANDLSTLIADVQGTGAVLNVKA